MKKAAILLIAIVVSAWCVHAGDNRGQNLLKNSSFELQGSGPFESAYWEYENPTVHGGRWGTARRQDWRSRGGNWEGTICGSWAEDTGGGWWQEVEARPGVTYNLSGWFFRDTDPGNEFQAREVAMKLEFRKGNCPDSVEILSVTNLIWGIENAWEPRYMRAVAPANTEWVRMVVFASDVGEEGSFHLDELRLVEEGGQGSYADYYPDR